MANSRKPGRKASLRLDRQQVAGLAGSLEKVLAQENVLTSARKRSTFSPTRPSVYSNLYCQLCGMPIYGTSYHKMEDGRISCARCFTSRIQSKEELEILYQSCKQDFCTFFQVELPKGIQLSQSVPESAPAHAKHTLWLTDAAGKNRQGLAIQNGEDFEIWLENGISEVITLGLLVQTLAVVWMMSSWNLEQLHQICKEKQPESEVLFHALIEGFQQWTSVQHLMFMQEKALARDLDQMYLDQDKPAAWGYKLFKKTYPLVSRPEFMRRTPFGTRIPIDLNRLKDLLVQEGYIKADQ